MNILMTKTDHNLNEKMENYVCQIFTYKYKTAVYQGVINIKIVQKQCDPA